MVDATVPRTPTRLRRSKLLRRLRRQPLGVAALALLTILILAVTFGPMLVPHEPSRTNPLAILQPPSAQHWLGTDELGRDVLARILAGGRVSMAVGLFSMLVGLSLGLSIGGAAGYFGGRFETLAMRLVDVF